jgi:biotin-dependent carboxylase-like uncharacterized protein
MGALRVIEAGPMTSVQDLGRPGFAASGVARSGAADTLSLRIGNRLLGNDENAAALELTLVGGLFRFESPTLICLAGTPAPGACIFSGDRPRPLEPWRPAPVGAGERVRIGRLAGGARSYLCLAGGVRTEPVLGSRSTHPAGGLGNPGRPLRPGDHVETGDPAPGLTVTSLAGAPRAEAERRLARRTLRVVPGAHHPVFDHAAVHALTRADFRVHPHSDRVGLRLEGPALPTPCGGRLASEGMIPGSIQVPPGGGPIVLATDAPTTGGYPVIACIIAADLPALGQRAPRDGIRFEWVDRAGAIDRLRELEAFIASTGPARRAARRPGRPEGADR